MDTHLDPTSIALLNLLTEKQKDYALTLYANREKKVSTAYILWVVFGVYYFYLGHPVKNILLWILFRISGMVKRKNQEILKICIAEAQQLYPSPVPPVHFEK